MLIYDRADNLPLEPDDPPPRSTLDEKISRFSIPLAVRDGRVKLKEIVNCAELEIAAPVNIVKKKSQKLTMKSI